MINVHPTNKQLILLFFPSAVYYPNCQKVNYIRKATCKFYLVRFLIQFFNYLLKLLGIGKIFSTGQDKIKYGSCSLNYFHVPNIVCNSLLRVRTGTRARALAHTHAHTHITLSELCVCVCI